MKIVHAKYASAVTTVPVNGRFTARFENHRAVLPDAVADYLAAVGGGHYSILAEDLSGIEAGSRVLIIRDTGLGDVLLLTPLIRRLHEDRGLLVDVLTQEANRPVLARNSHIRETFALENDATDRAAYAFVLDLRLVVENAERAGRHDHRADAFAGYADVKLHGEEDRRIDYVVAESEETWAREECRRYRGEVDADGAPIDTPVKGLIGYVWSASAGNRTWSDETHLAMLEALLKDGYRVVVLSAERTDVPNGLHAGGLINLSGCLPIRDTAAIMSQCDVVLTPDTGLFHLAGALDKATVAYFGSFPVEERHSHRKLSVINDARGNCALAPCRNYRCLNRDEQGQARCLSVNPARVLDAVAGHLKAAREFRQKRSSAEELRSSGEEGDDANAIVAGPEAPPDPSPTGGNREPRRRGSSRERRRTRADDSGLAAAEAR